MGITSILTLVIGILLLVAGRKFYWLSIGVLGVLAGILIAARLFPESSEWVRLLMAAALGVVGAVGAIMLQKIAVAALGFIAGGFLVLNLVQELRWVGESAFWLPFVIGGIVGAILLSRIFEWTLIVLSSVAGAYLVMREIPVSHSSHIILLLILTAAGVLIQSNMTGKKGSRSSRPGARKRRAEAAGGEKP